MEANDQKQYKHRFYKWKDMLPWQKKRLGLSLGLFLIISISFLFYVTTTMSSEKKSDQEYWDSYMVIDKDVQAKIDQYGTNATNVAVGTYVDNLKEISLKSNYYRGEYLIWFKWTGDKITDMTDQFRIYKGTINKKELVKDYHKENTHYQLFRIDATISKTFWTARFPLESHQLRMYIESNKTVDDIIFTCDENSGFNPNLTLAGYNFTKVDTAQAAVEYNSSHGDPEYDGNLVTSEHVTQMEINRADFGTYLKCFIALIGTTTWVFITLYICTNHHVDPLSMIPAALFGTVSNIMVGANLVPDALQIGLLEYVNFWGIFTILTVAFCIININRIRNKFKDNEFAHFYGLIMFYAVVIIILLGHILMPLSAYLF